MDHGILLNRKELALATSFLRKTPMIYTCRNIIHHHLFGNGILFSHRRGRIRPDPHMQEIMTDYWLPFCKDVFDSVLAIGVAVVRIVQMEDGLRIPVVIDAMCCRIKMTYNFGVREYMVMNDQQQEIPDSFVLDIFGYAPQYNGQLTSILCNLIPRIQFMNMLMGTSLTMEQKRANPVVMTEAVDIKADNVEGINYDYYADGDMQDTSDQNRFRRNRSNVAQLAHQQAMYDAFFSGSVAQPSTGASALDNVVTLPLGQRIVNTPHQSAPLGAVVSMMKAHEDVLCSVMGVPRSLVMSDTPHKSDAEGTHETFQKTLLCWKTHLQEACQQVYNLIYADSIKKQLINAMGKKRKRTANVADVYALKKRLQVEITFPISPFISHEQLFMHWQRGVVPWDTYVQHACAAACLPHTEMPEPTSRGSSERNSSDTNEEEEGEKPISKKGSKDASNDEPEDVKE